MKRTPTKLEIIGKYLKTQREKKGFNQQQLAAKLGWKVSQSISNIERGITSIPVNKVTKYCKTINADVTMVKEDMARNYLDNLK